MKKLLCSLAVLALVSPLMADIYMAGDSTMCDYKKSSQVPQKGWGQALQWFMKDSLKLHNHAIGGRSTKIFTNEGRWKAIVDALKSDDWVIIAFGHNDSNRHKADRYATVDEYRNYMRGFVADVRGKKANVIFATSIPHSGGFTKTADGKLAVCGGAAGSGPYVEATRELAKELSVPLVDLNAYAANDLSKRGFDAANKLYMRIAPGEYVNLPQGKNDGCHIRDTGAFYYAQIAVKLCREQKLGICSYFKADSDVHFKPIPPEGIPQPKPADNWRDEIRALRREAMNRGMDKASAERWAAQEFHRRQVEKTTAK